MFSITCIKLTFTSCCREYSSYFIFGSLQYYFFTLFISYNTPSLPLH
nr:MAG TPA: hypothetical protein [Caudoviricetes sp.]